MRTVSILWNLAVGILVCVLVLLLVTFFAVGFLESVKGYLVCFLGVKPSDKFEILKFLGIGMGGILLALQALASHKRAKAMEDSAKAQADAANAQAKATEATEQGQRQERLKNAIEHLGHQSVSVRLGGAYELFHLAQDTEGLRKTVLDILCAHIRRTTGEDEYRETYKSKPSEEIQSLLTLLFVQDHELFKGLPINLKGSWLNGAKLQGARFRKVELSGAYLQGTELFKADLKEAQLMNNVYMQGAFLHSAQLQGATLMLTHLEGSSLDNAQLQGSGLFMVYLQGATLGRTCLQGVVQISKFSSFADQIRRLIGRESDLSKVVFKGGLSRQDVYSVAGSLSNEKARLFIQKLGPHIDEPSSSQLPENCDAISGSYTKEEAEQWIAEYEESHIRGSGNR